MWFNDLLKHALYISSKQLPVTKTPKDPKDCPYTSLIQYLVGDLTYVGPSLSLKKLYSANSCSSGWIML